jgi:hypothetical protein
MTGIWTLLCGDVRENKKKNDGGIKAIHLDFSP